MKQRNRKKGFSLIELIVVIAVIAAIAAVIVPQFSNITGAAKKSADKRNVQLWNSIYLDVVVATGSNTTAGLPTAVTTTTVSAIAVSYQLSGQTVNFNAPSFSVTSTTVVPTFVQGTGITSTY